MAVAMSLCVYSCDCLCFQVQRNFSYLPILFPEVGMQEDV